MPVRCTGHTDGDSTATLRACDEGRYNENVRRTGTSVGSCRTAAAGVALTHGRHTSFSAYISRSERLEQEQTDTRDVTNIPMPNSHLRHPQVASATDQHLIFTTKNHCVSTCIPTHLSTMSTWADNWYPLDPICRYKLFQARTWFTSCNESSLF